MDLKRIFNQNKTWVAGKLNVDADYFKNLAKGQSPEILYIGCSDSRVTAEDMMGIEPGEAFIHRNIANMVPNTDLSAMAVITYAVKYLEVKHIVVCGHYECGGVKAAMESADLGILNPWLRNIRDVYRTHKDELNSIVDTPAKYRRLVELNVREQCINVLKTTDVQRAVTHRNLTVHGWVLDVVSGKLIDLELDYNNLLEGIREIYRLD